MSLSYQELLADLKQASGNSLVSHFYDLLYDKSINYHINGYSIITMTPPHLSGLGLTPEAISSNGLIDNILFAIDFSGPGQRVEVSSSQGIVPYATKKTTSGDISCSYLDSDNLFIFGFHKTWIDYISSVRRGELEPSGNYIDNNELDYVASIYAVTFKPDMTSPVYVSKGVGCFPNSLEDKEIIGSRSSNELSIMSMSYTCADYQMDSSKGSLYNDFIENIATSYG